MAEARRQWKEKIIWINFPSCLHLKAPKQIEVCVREILEAVAPGERFLIRHHRGYSRQRVADILASDLERVAKIGTLPIE